MTDLMNEMIQAAAIRAHKNGYAFERRKTKIGEVVLSAQMVNTNSKNSEFRKNWQLNGKRISAAKLAMM